MAALVALHATVLPVLVPAPAWAGDGTGGGGSALSVPRFVTLASGEVNVRTGPGVRYPIRLVIRRQGLPVEITREFDTWRQVRDRDGDQGWVHKSMLSGRRAVVVGGDDPQVLRRRPDAAARPVVRLAPGVIAGLKTCRDAWCRLEIGGYAGWLERARLWGVYADERFKD